MRQRDNTHLLPDARTINTSRVVQRLWNSLHASQEQDEGEPEGDPRANEAERRQDRIEIAEPLSIQTKRLQHLIERPIGRVDPDKGLRDHDHSNGLREKD